MSHLCSPYGQEVKFLPLGLSASFLNMLPSKAVRIYPHIDGFIFQSDVFCLIRLHTPFKHHMARCPLVKPMAGEQHQNRGRAKLTYNLHRWKNSTVLKSGEVG